jgi:hypothetical protein
MDQVTEMVRAWGPEHKATWFDLMAIDYAFHHEDIDYDGGLSFIDRLYKKLKSSKPSWNLADLKRRASSLETYHRIISAMLSSQSDIDYYGV